MYQYDTNLTNIFTNQLTISLIILFYLSVHYGFQYIIIIIGIYKKLHKVSYLLIRQTIVA